MEFLDGDGDWIQFSIDTKGKLCERLNGKAEIPEVEWLSYSIKGRSVSDCKGIIQLQPECYVEQALGLRALARRAGVEWRGDEPEPAARLILTDTDGDRLEFFVASDGKVQEYSNGKLEIEGITRLKFSFLEGTLEDDTGTFTLRPRECVQKAAALKSIAEQAGIAWEGDDPSATPALPTLQQPALGDIENCGTEWEFQCPKKWEDLQKTERPGQRFCEACQETVYFCASQQEVQEHAEQRRCVAFDADLEARASGPVGELPLTVYLLSGAELATVHVPASGQVGDVKKQLVPAAKVPVSRIKLLFQDRILADGDSISDLDLSKGVIQYVQVPGRPENPEERPRKMGKKKVRPRIT